MVVRNINFKLSVIARALARSKPPSCKNSLSSVEDCFTLRARNDKRRHQKGQAVIEMAMCLPFLIWLIYYTINAYMSVHTAQIGQRYAAMSTFDRVNHRAKFPIDDVTRQITSRQFIAVQYMDPEGGAAPQRKILVGPLQIRTIIGVCNEPECN